MSKISKISTLYKKGLSGHEIAKLTGFNRSYVYRVISKINKAITKETSDVEEGQTRRRVVSSNNNVHAHRVRFFVRLMGDKYRKNPNARYVDFVPDVDVTCKGKVIYARSKKKFGGVDEVAAMEASLSFWDHVARRLEDRLNISIGGRGKAAFEFLYEETETRDSELAADGVVRGRRWVVTHNDDGKLRLATDWSDGELNHETYHARDGHLDSITFNRFVNGVLDAPDAPTYDELVKLMARQAVLNGETSALNKEGAAGLKALIDVLNVGKKDVDDSRDVFVGRPDYFG